MDAGRKLKVGENKVASEFGKNQPKLSYYDFKNDPQKWPPKIRMMISIAPREKIKTVLKSVTKMDLESSKGICGCYRLVQTVTA